MCTFDSLYVYNALTILLLHIFSNKILDSNNKVKICTFIENNTN